MMCSFSPMFCSAGLDGFFADSNVPFNRTASFLILLLLQVPGDAASGDSRQGLDLPYGKPLFFQLVKIGEVRIGMDGAIEPFQVIILFVPLAEGDGGLDQILQVSGIGDRGHGHDDLAEQPAVPAAGFELGEIEVHDGICDIEQVFLGVGVEVDGEVEAAEQRFVEGVIQVRRGDEDDGTAEIVQSFQNGRGGPSHFPKVIAVRPVHGDGVDLVKKDGDGLRLREGVDLIEQAGDVL